MLLLDSCPSRLFEVKNPVASEMSSNTGSMSLVGASSMVTATLAFASASTYGTWENLPGVVSQGDAADVGGWELMGFLRIGLNSTPLYIESKSSTNMNIY